MNPGPTRDGGKAQPPAGTDARIRALAPNVYTDPRIMELRAQPKIGQSSSMLRTLAGLCLTLALGASAHAALILNAGQPITQVVTMQPIVVSDNDGSNTATYFGSAAQQAAIFALIDQIWAQAGINVEWLAPNFYNNTFANIGSATPGSPGTARSTNDLGTIVAAGDIAGVGNSNPLIIDIYFVRAAAGFQVLGLNSAAGLAFVGGNGITAYVGSNLLTFQSGLEAIASVIAHEIGHNLGLPHIVEAENLMQAGGSPNEGERLNAAQITTSLASNLSTSVPEPSTYILISLALPILLLRRRATR